MVGQQGNPYPKLFNMSYESWMAAVSRGEVSLNVRVANSDQFGGLNNGPPGSIISAGNPTLMQALSQGHGQNGTNGLNGVGASGGTVNSGSGSTNTNPGEFQNTAMGGTQTIDPKQMVGFNFGATSGTSNSPTALDLGAAGSTFAVLGGSAITNTGASVIFGNVGVAPGTSITGFGSATINGTTHNNDATSIQAQADLLAAFTAGNLLTPNQTTLTGDIGGRTLGPGVYPASSSLGITGTLTLDGGGDPNAVWVFQIVSTLTTASGNSQVNFINGAQAKNVFWQVGSSATLGTASQWQGNILALTSITLVDNANLIGRALARNGAVSLGTNNVITLP